MNNHVKLNYLYCPKAITHKCGLYGGNIML